MISQNVSFGPRWTVKTRDGHEVACHARSDAEELDRGEISIEAARKRNSEIEAKYDIAEFYEKYD